jgi:hypothetical protein
MSELSKAEIAALQNVIRWAESTDFTLEEAYAGDPEEAREGDVSPRTLAARKKMLSDARAALAKIKRLSKQPNLTSDEWTTVLFGLRLAPDGMDIESDPNERRERNRIAEVHDKLCEQLGRSNVPKMGRA